MIVLNILMVVVFAYQAIAAIYSALFSIAGRLKMYKEVSPTGIFRKFAVLIPSYKEDAVILETVRMALRQSYPKDRFDIIVIADSLRYKTINELKRLPVKVIEVSFDVSTKAKSLNRAMELLPEVYDYALVLDADNIMEEDFIEILNSIFVRKGVKVIQGHRIAKNLNTDFAVLDAISEEVNNHIFRRGHRALGLSSGLIGSGMAFDYGIFKEVMATNKAIGGFDKELELKLLRKGIEIEFAEEAYIYDEKVENDQIFRNQRRRWISAQFYYFRKYFFSSLWHLLKYGNINYFDKALQQFMLPRVIMMGTTAVFTISALVSEFFYNWILYPGANWYVLILFLHTAALLLAIPDHFYNKRTLQASFSLPKAVLIMFVTLFHLKGANKKFIHTPHSGSINQVNRENIK